VGDGQLRLTVADNGIGPGHGLDERSGLANMRQRATAHHGTLTITTAPGGGTHIGRSVPLT
jgi:two-component system sensor histidine kinase DevS